MEVKEKDILTYLLVVEQNRHTIRAGGWYRTRVENDLGGGFKYVLFSPLCGEDSHFD